MTDVRQIVHELLAQLGSSREAQQYLKEFSGTNQARFAVVKVGGGILRDHLEELTSALAFLHRLGLIPVAILSALLAPTLFTGSDPRSFDPARPELLVAKERVCGSSRLTKSFLHFTEREI